MSIVHAIAIGHERVEIDLTNVGPVVQVWRPSDTLPDVRIFAQRVGDVYLIEREVSNRSLVIGHKERTKPRIQCPISDMPPSGWAIADPRQGKNPSDWPMGRASWRRYVLYQGTANGAAADAAMRLALGTFRADWRGVAAKFGPCNMALPRLGDQQRVRIMSEDGASARFVLNSVINGTQFHVEDYSDGVLLPMLDWNPIGGQDGAEVGGTGVYFTTGWHQNVPDLQRAFILAQCEHERAKGWYVRETGEPISTEHYQGQTPDIWGAPFVPPEAQIANTGGDFLPVPYDYAHEIRGFRRTAQVAEQALSPMATFSLRSLSSLARLRFSQRGRLPSPGYAPVNLTTLQWNASSAPGAKTADGYVNLNLGPNTGLFGSTCGRQIGWSAFEVAYTAKLCGWSAESRLWAESFLIFLDTAVSPTGPIQKAKGGSGNWPNVFSCQTFEQVILAYGAMALAVQLGKPTPTFVARVIENIYGPDTLLPMLGNGPPHYIRTAEANGAPVQRLSDPAPNGTGDLYGDPAHAEAACALAATFDLNPQRWLDRSCLYNHPFPNVEAKLAWLTSSDVTHLDWEAFLVGQMQAHV